MRNFKLQDVKVEKEVKEEDGSVCAEVPEEKEEIRAASKEEPKVEKEQTEKAVKPLALEKEKKEEKQEDFDLNSVEEGIDLMTIPEPKTPPKTYEGMENQNWTVDSFGNDKY